MPPSICRILRNVMESASCVSSDDVTEAHQGLMHTMKQTYQTAQAQHDEALRIMTEKKNKWKARYRLTCKQLTETTDLLALQEKVDLTHQLNIQTERNQGLQKDLEALQVDHTAVQDTFKKVVEDLILHKDSLRKENQTLSTKLEGLEDEAQRLTTDVERLDAEKQQLCDDLAEKLHQHLQEAIQFERKVEERDNIISTIQEELQFFKQHYEARQKELRTQKYKTILKRCVAKITLERKNQTRIRWENLAKAAGKKKQLHQETVFACVQNMLDVQRLASDNQHQQAAAIHRRLTVKRLQRQFQKEIREFTSEESSYQKCAKWKRVAWSMIYKKRATALAWKQIHEHVSRNKRQCSVSLMQNNKKTTEAITKTLEEEKGAQVAEIQKKLETKRKLRELNRHLIPERKKTRLEKLQGRISELENQLYSASGANPTLTRSQTGLPYHNTNRSGFHTARSFVTTSSTQKHSTSSNSPFFGSPMSAPIPLSSMERMDPLFHLASPSPTRIPLTARPSSSSPSPLQDRTPSYNSPTTNSTIPCPYDGFDSTPDGSQANSDSEDEDPTTTTTKGRNQEEVTSPTTSSPTVPRLRLGALKPMEETSDEHGVTCEDSSVCDNTSGSTTTTTTNTTQQTKTKSSNLNSSRKRGGSLTIGTPPRARQNSINNKRNTTTSINTPTTSNTNGKPTGRVSSATTPKTQCGDVSSASSVYKQGRTGPPVTSPTPAHHTNTDNKPKLYDCTFAPISPPPVGSYTPRGTSHGPQTPQSNSGTAKFVSTKKATERNKLAVKKSSRTPRTPRPTNITTPAVRGE